MTSHANGLQNTKNDGAPKPRRHIRQATVILPTGKRMKRNVTFDTIHGLDGLHGDGAPQESSPLLGRRGSYKKRRTCREALLSKAKQWNKQLWEYANSRTGKGVFKCSLAYVLGSLATYVPQISGLLGQQDGKHMVATVTVYFHPARSLGSMLQAVICAIVAFLYAVFICFSSMGVSIFFGDQLKQIVLGHIVVLVLFCGAGLGFVGWVKQRLGNPLVNVSCSLTCLAIITVLTKEGAVQAAEFSDDKISQVMLMIAMGVLATTAVALLIWPISARVGLQEDLAKVTDSFGDLLTIITRGFLAGSDEEFHQQAFQDATNKNKKLYASLTKNLKEAKYEHYVLGTEREYRLIFNLVNCMQRLSQNIGGLRSAATTQFLLIAQSQSRDSSDTPTILKSKKPEDSYFTQLSPDIMSPAEGYSVLSSKNQTPLERSSDASLTGANHSTSHNSGSVSSMSSPDDIFSSFIIQLGPSMKSLAITLKKILDELPFAADGSIAVNAHFRSSLADAINLYTNSRQTALQLLYKNKELSKVRPLELEADFEEVAASCGYFSFSLLDLANDMNAYLEILDELKLEVEERPEGRTWTWLKFWQRLPLFKKNIYKDAERDQLIDQNELNDVPGDIPSPISRKATQASQANSSSRVDTLRYRLWRALRFFRRDDIKYAIKVGVGAALYALPSFLRSTRPIYQHWRGEWGLLSYMLVCSMTVGSSNNTGFARFAGTCVGAICAILAWTISQGNGYLMAFFGWIMSYWTAYITVAQGNGPLGRFIMLTYNLSALYAYSLSVKDMDRDDDEGGVSPIITDITLHRVVAVLSGCLWGLIITRLIWPISARQKFKDGLSLLWLRMGLIWKRDPLHILLPSPLPFTSTPNAYMDLREEFELHRFLTKLDNLRGSASAEFDLRGPFPDEVYARILESTTNMLDAFHAMNVSIMKNPRASKGEADILKYTVRERAMLCARISHLFQVLASSMKLQYPLNEALPSADNARDRLLAKLFQFRKEEKRTSAATDEDFEMLYAYALVTGQLSKEIQDLGKELENLFGVLNEDILKLQ